MAEPFLAEIRIMGFNFPPRGWAQCDGQILPINQNQSLYSLLGTTYGGDGRTTFGLPELRGRTPIHPGNGHTQGEKAGVESVALTADQNPPHTHPMNAASVAANSDLIANRLPSITPVPAYKSSGTEVDMAPQVVQTAGGQPHDNMQPWLALNFCIAIQGLFPSRN